MTEGDPMSLANHRAWRAFGGNICCSAFDGTSAPVEHVRSHCPGLIATLIAMGPGGRASARSRARARLRVVPPALAGVHPKAERAALARTYHEVREPTLATDARRLEVQPDPGRRSRDGSQSRAGARASANGRQPFSGRSLTGRFPPARRPWPAPGRSSPRRRRSDAASSKYQPSAAAIASARSASGWPSAWARAAWRSVVAAAVVA
jgi:hypothetical protein